MGSNMAYDLANSDVELEIALTQHLLYNHYPPVHLGFIPSCIEAIQAVEDGEYRKQITMMNGKTLTAGEIVNGLHLEFFVDRGDEYID